MGRDRSGWFEPAVQGYAKRIRHHARLELVELPAAGGSLPADGARRREAETLLRRLDDDAQLIVLDERGSPLDSVGFSRLVGESRSAGRDLSFVVGGDEGLDPSVHERAWKVLSLSAMTLPHRLARLLLLEQLYRAFAILGGEPYHK